ncbi:hypothetical protein SAMN04487859_10667 [Roseovarius lutimaris]|uniref:Uncharacterized protein n=1 Tax=Roseovarius lutimaris TaxID=1005928 RepID=A0A1I5AM89_9RHOB|nr:hypothetical protein [Roseovarius lutimaris]SFN63319.1 hypothetical protein SAMN04487859_10667 [Roseovarius lutimaris]
MLTGKINIIAGFLLLALINIAVGLVLLRFPIATGTTRWTSCLALAGMLMPLSILTEVVFGMLPLFVVIGAISMVLAMGWLTVAVWQTEAPR